MIHKCSKSSITSSCVVETTWRFYRGSTIRVALAISIIFTLLILRVWNKHLKSLNLTAADVVLIQIGSWNLAFNGLRQVMSHSIALFRVGLKTISAELGSRRTPLFLFTKIVKILHGSNFDLDTITCRVLSVPGMHQVNCERILCVP